MPVMLDSDSGVGIDPGITPFFCLNLNQENPIVLELESESCLSCYIMVGSESENIRWNQNWSGIRYFFPEIGIRIGIINLKNAAIRIGIKACPESSITAKCKHDPR